MKNVQDDDTVVARQLRRGANLMIAANDLYEAAKQAEYAFRVPAGERIDAELKALELLRKAIAKADGKSARVLDRNSAT